MGTGKGHTVALGSETNPRTEPASGEAPTASPSIAPGSLVADKYRVVRTIGEGGMGVVVEAMHIHLGQRVAIKFLKREARSDGEIVARFAREARAAVQLTSEHVARVMDIGTLPDGAPFMVMEYLEGKDLSVVLAETGALPIEDAVEYVIQICDGLAEAHARGIVHRDVKTENLFLVERGGGMRIAKLLDFGISKAALTGEASDVDVRSAKTTQIMGSPFYMSPEQLKSTVDVDHRTDIWSLGAVLFELLAGDTAFEGETFTSLVIRINNEAPRDLQALNPAVPDALVGIVRRCLEKNPADRFPNAAELAIALLPYARKRARVPAERAASITRDAGLGAATLVLPASELPPSMSLRDSAGRVSSSRMGVASSTNDAVVTPQESAPPSKGKMGMVLVALALLVVVVLAFFLGQRRGSETTGAAVDVHGPETEAKVAPSTLPAPSASAVVPTSTPVPPAPTTPPASDVPVAATASVPKSAEPKSVVKAAPAPAAAPPKPKPKSSAGGLDIRMER